MKFPADMGISNSTVKWPRSLGHDAVRLRDQSLEGSSDLDVIKKAQMENRIVITCDLDFGAIMAYTSDLSPGIIILRLKNETPDNVNKRLTQVFEQSSDCLDGGSIIIVEEAFHRIRNFLS